MLRDLLLPPYDGPRTVGPQLERLNQPLVLPEANTDALSVQEYFPQKELQKTISCRLCQLQDGTALTGSLNDYSVGSKEYKCCARNATKLKPRRKTVSDVNTLAKLKARLKNMLAADKEHQAARAIELAAQELLNPATRFVYQGEAKALAAISLDELDTFIKEVKRIRTDLDTEYYFATKTLIEGDEENENAGTD